jgi:hypothetical protein
MMSIDRLIVMNVPRFFAGVSDAIWMPGSMTHFNSLGAVTGSFHPVIFLADKKCCIARFKCCVKDSQSLKE